MKLRATQYNIIQFYDQVCCHCCLRYSEFIVLEHNLVQKGFHLSRTGSHWPRWQYRKYLSFKGKQVKLVKNIYIYVLFAVLLPQLEVIAVYRFAALPSYLILLLIQVCPVDFSSKLLHWSRNGFRELGDHGGIGIGKNTTHVLRHDKYTVNPHEVKQVAIL